MPVSPSPAAPAPLPPARPAASSASPMSPGLVVLILSLLLGIQPVTTDLYLPSLPTLTEGFGAAMAQAQLTLSALLLAFGLSQLLWGPLSDRFGRRPVLMLGLAAYTLAAVGSAAAPSMEMLIVWRTVQGAAMGAAVMGARAVVRDLYQPETGARVMSKGLSGLGLIACISPPLGGLISDFASWRAALLVLAVFGATALAVVALRFKETVPHKNPAALRPGTLLRTWAGIVRHPTFVAYTLLATASYATLFTFLAGSSFVLIRVLGLGKTAYGITMASSAFAYLAGTFLCRRLLPRFGVRRSVALAGLLSLTGGTLVGTLALAGWHSLWAIQLPLYLVMLAHGVHQPCSQSGAVAPFPRAAGTASALNGVSMMIAAFAVGGWLGHRFDGTVFPLTNTIWFLTVVIALVAWTLVQKHGDPARAVAPAVP